MRTFLRPGTLGAACLLAFPLVAVAQYDNGSLLGTIRDSTGAPIAGAQVTLKNIATGITSQVQTGAAGDYEFPTVRVGTYTVDASAPTFSNALAENINVTVGGRQRIDLGLKAGSTATTVEGLRRRPSGGNRNLERGQVITNYQSEALPLVTRNYSDLLGLVTGSRQAPARPPPAPSTP